MSISFKQNILDKRLAESSATVNNNNNKSNNIQSSNYKKTKLAIPPLLGVGASVISSSIYSSKKNDEFIRKLGNFKEGLELGFDSSALAESIKSEILAKTDKIKALEKENIDILAGIELTKKHAGTCEKDKIKFINADMDIYNINKDIIEECKEKITELNDMLDKLYKKIVTDQLSNKKSELESITKSQIKKFKIATITGFLALGAIISFTISKITNKKVSESK